MSVEALAQSSGSGGTEDDCETCVENMILEYVFCVGGRLDWENGQLVCKVWTGDKAKCKSQSGANCDQSQQTGCECADEPEDS